MQTIIRRTAAVAMVALLAAAAGCTGETPTYATVSPAGALHDGGAAFGSGSRDTDPGDDTTAADTGSAARGGGTFGSGS